MKILETLLNKLFVRARNAKNFADFRKSARFVIHDFFTEFADFLFTSIEVSGEEVPAK